MTRSKKILIACLVLLVVIQFVRLSPNNGDGHGEKEISKKYNVPAEVQAILEQSCYDCHSNHTNYPWYTNIQPIGWWIQISHVNDGKRHLNFSEFASYPEKRAKKKIEEIADEIREGGMPLGSYTFIHRDAVLTGPQSKTLIDWAESLK
jgi:hypothetical protein